MPFFRHLPKRGFSNDRFERRYEIVNICQLEIFEDGSTVGIGQLSRAGLVGSEKSRVKVLGKGELSKKLSISAHKFSKSAEEKIVGTGGSVNIIG